MTSLIKPSFEEFEIGSIVEIIDSDGSSVGRKGDQGKVIGFSINSTSIGPNGMKCPVMEVRMLTGKHVGQASGRFSYRYKLISGDWDL
jgi:small-conductance mechanosensitive channel